MNANELLKLISKQWCNLSDLMLLLGCGRNKALDIKRDRHPIRNFLANIFKYLRENTKQGGFFNKIFAF